MPKSGELKLTTRGDREILMTRDFNAPRHLVWDAFTKPELIKRWLLGPDGWSMPVCEVDLRVGGKYRYVWRNDSDGQEMGMGGVFRKVDRPNRIINTEKFDEAWYPGEAVNTTEFAEQSGKTTVTQNILYESKDARDGILKSGMESGVSRSYERLEEVLASTAPARTTKAEATEARQ
ncbi:MAG TPA: SRPBCC family protein [Gemmatimonadaceae bacterium]|nr:SRPBCC family protein [Gemmatimonadaceae bacterium]